MHRTADADGRGRLAATLRRLFIRPPDAPCAAHAQRRDAVHDYLLRQPNGGEELQHHGRRQSGAGSAVCYLAAEFGPKGIRVHAISRTAGDAGGWTRRERKPRRSASSASTMSASPPRFWRTTRHASSPARPFISTAVTTLLTC